MRDPNRIPAILAALSEYWVKHPDLRLGQIVCNLKLNTFFAEDDAALAILQEAAAAPSKHVQPQSTPVADDWLFSLSRAIANRSFVPGDVPLCRVCGNKTESQHGADRRDSSICWCDEEDQDEIP